MKKYLLLPFLGLLSLTLTFSCVKDTDFDQAEDVVITPIVELNLVHFNLEASQFYDATTMSQRLTVRDTTEIRFLDDSSIQESLVKAEFFFRFTNSIPRTFNVDFQFLNELDELAYLTETSVNEGSLETPRVTEFTHTVEGEEIAQLTMADKVVVSVTIPSSSLALQGTLNMQSKTTYFLEITERE